VDRVLRGSLEAEGAQEGLVQAVYDIVNELCCSRSQKILTLLKHHKLLKRFNVRRFI